MTFAFCVEFSSRGRMSQCLGNRQGILVLLLKLMRAPKKFFDREAISDHVKFKFKRLKNGKFLETIFLKSLEPHLAISKI